MTRPRIVETDQGISGEQIVEQYNQMQRNFRDKGLMETKSVIASGIDHGLVLELGPGPGYLGLEWLKSTRGTRLRGFDISPEMVDLARKNAEEYGLSDRVDYLLGDGQKLAFEDNLFDGVFTCSSFHEWSEPEKTLVEIHRVLKPGGRYYINDLKRDISLPIRWFMYLMVKPKEIRPGFLTSVNAAYTRQEAQALVRKTPLADAKVSQNLMGLVIEGVKG